MTPAGSAISTSSTCSDGPLVVFGTGRRNVNHRSAFLRNDEQLVVLQILGQRSDRRHLRGRIEEQHLAEPRMVDDRGKRWSVSGEGNGDDHVVESVHRG